ncbi:MAG: hypothetical protein V1777_01980 [Candidatus Micrarchaeota archaeon]
MKPTKRPARFSAPIALGLAAAFLGFGIGRATTKEAEPAKTFSVSTDKIPMEEPELVVFLWKNLLREQIRQKLTSDNVVNHEIKTASSLEEAALRLQNRLSNEDINDLNLKVRIWLNENPAFQKQAQELFRVNNSRNWWKHYALSASILAGLGGLAAGYSIGRRPVRPVGPKLPKDLAGKRRFARRALVRSQRLPIGIRPHRTQHRLGR